MRKRMVKILSLVLIMMLVGSNSIFASEISGIDINTLGDEDVIQPRSLYLAAASSEITNEGQGVLNIYADFTSHAGVEWGKITIYLYRRKSANSGTWSRVDTFTEEFDGADYPDGKITYAYTEFEVHGLDTDYYYRLTCDHKVKTPNGYETKTSQTNGVLLTSYPVFRRGDEIK